LNVFKRKALVSTISLVFVLSVFILPIQLGANISYVQTRNTIAVVQTSSDSAIAKSIEEMNLTRFNHPMVFIQVKSPAILQSIAQNSKYLITIYVGHGNPEGLKVGASTVSWSSLNDWIENTELTFSIIVSCYSREAVPFESRKSFGFPGVVDSRIAGLFTQILIAGLLNILDVVQILLAKFFTSEFLALILNPQLPLAWGPWSDWMTNEALNTIMTGALWMILAAGIVAFLIFIGPYILIYLPELAWLVYLLGTSFGAWLFGGIVGILGAVCAKLELWYRTRYDSETHLFWDQAFFALKSLIFHFYYWYSPVVENIHY